MLKLFRIVIDYSDLADKHKDLFDSDEVRREGDRLQRHVNELSNTIQRIQAPNMRVFGNVNHFKPNQISLHFEIGHAKTRTCAR